MGKSLLGLAALVIILALAIWWHIFNYKECMKVGHSEAYCVMNIGAK